MLSSLKHKILFGIIISFIISIFMLISLYSSYRNLKNENKALQQEINNQSLYIEKKSKENQNLQIRYNNIVNNLESDYCGRQPIPDYLKVAIQEILNEK